MTVESIRQRASLIWREREVTVFHKPLACERQKTRKSSERNGHKYELAGRGAFDYVLELREDRLTVVKSEYMSTEELAAGALAFRQEKGEAVLYMKEQ